MPPGPARPGSRWIAGGAICPGAAGVRKAGGAANGRTAPAVAGRCRLRRAVQRRQALATPHRPYRGSRPRCRPAWHGTSGRARGVHARRRRRQVQLAGDRRGHAHGDRRRAQRLLADHRPRLRKLRRIDPLEGAGHRSRGNHRAGRHHRRGAAIGEVAERGVAVDGGEVGYVRGVDLAEVTIAGAIPRMERLARPERQPADPARGERGTDADADHGADAQERDQRGRIDRRDSHRTRRRGSSPSVRRSRPSGRSGTARSPRGRCPSTSSPRVRHRPSFRRDRAPSRAPPAGTRPGHSPGLSAQEPYCARSSPPGIAATTGGGAMPCGCGGRSRSSIAVRNASRCAGPM